jgi:tetratricopeptide (TPR) repeat protein
MTSLTDRLGRALAGRYSIERQLGEGAMGTVFLAHDRRHDRRVAIKVFRPEVAEVMGAERFLQEIRFAAKLDHPHILMLIDSGEADGLLHYVMPFVDGETLRDRLTREQRMSVSEALRIAAQVADALDYAHKHGVVHRDIKPENILLANGHAKVADFGIARSASDVGERLTMTGMSVGTPAYMSPEQFLGEPNIDGRSDVYSLGCVLFEMLSGTTPFSGSSMQATMAKRIMQDAERVSTLRPDVPPMVDLVLARALSREADDRHTSAGELAAALLAEISGTSAAGMPSGEGSIGPTKRTPLIGRERELDDARALIAGLAHARGGMLMIGGEPGVGKTRLCQAILDEARARGALCLVGHCYEMEGTPPFTPYAELLDVVSRLVPARTFRETLGDAAPEIARILPSLRQTFPDIPEPLDLPPDRQRQHLYTKYREFTERSARIAPIVVLFDDLHWADEASLGLIENTAAYLAELPIIALGTYRDVDLDVNRGFARLLETLTRQRLARRISLKRLPAERVSDLLGALGGASPPAELARVIYHETDGNPFFVEEVFAHLKEEGRLFDADGKWRTDLRVEDLDVPEGVRLVIGRRLERLSETCRAVLTSAAVIGPRFNLRVLEEVGDAKDEELLDALDAAVQAHLITEQRGGRDVSYAFSHELIRQTLISGLSLPRRQRRHLKIASAMERVWGDRINTRASDLAYHLYQAGAAADPDKTLHFLTLAAEQAIDSAAYGEALAHCERAATIEDATEKQALARLAFVRANALLGNGRWVDAVQGFLAALEAAIGAGDVELTATAGQNASWYTGWMGDFVSGERHARRAFENSNGADPLTRARVMSQIAGHGAIARLDLSDFDREMTEAFEIGPANNPIHAAFMDLGQCWVNTQFARIDAAVAAGNRAMPVFASPHYRQVYLETAGHRHNAMFYGGAWETMDAERDELLAMATESGNIGALLNIDVGHIVTECARAGDWRALESRCRGTLERWTGVGPWAQLMQGPAGIAQLHRGEIADALSTCETARKQFPRTAWLGFIEAPELLCAAFAEDESIWEARRAEFAPLGSQMLSTMTIGRAAYVTTLAWTYHVRGRRAELAALYPTLTELIDWGFRCTGIDMVDTVAGVAAMAADRWDGAEHHFERAISHAERIQHRFALPAAHHSYAEMLIARSAPGDSVRASALLRRAMDEYRSMGMTLMLKRAEPLLATVTTSTGR